MKATGTTGAPSQERAFRSARQVLECLSYGLIIMIEHSVFLVPTKLASLYSAAYPKLKVERI